MKKPIFIFCLMFWTFAAGAYSQYKAGKVAGAVVKAVRAAGNIKPPVVPPVPPAIPQQVHAFPKIDTPSVPVDTSSVSYAIPPAISSVKPPKDPARKRHAALGLAFSCRHRYPWRVHLYML